MQRFGNHGSAVDQAIIILLALPFMIAAQPLALAQPNDERVKERFLREAPQSWEEYIRLAASLQGSCAAHSETDSFGGTKSEERYEHKANPNGKLIKRLFSDSKAGKVEDAGEEVHGFNPKYAFVLRRVRQSAPWLLTELVDLSKQGLPDAIALRMKISDSRHSGLVRLNGEPLAKLAQSPTFRVMRCRAITEGSEELVELVFARPLEIGAKTRLHESSPVQGGVLILDPQRYWCIRAYEVEEKILSVMTGTRKGRMFQPSDTSALMPVCVRAEFSGESTFSSELTAKGVGSKTHSRWEFDLKEPDDLPDDKEFTLTAFGLPEPPGLQWPRPTPWYLWAGVAAGACLGLGAFFTWLKRRSAAT